MDVEEPEDHAENTTAPRQRELISATAYDWDDTEIIYMYEELRRHKEAIKKAEAAQREYERKLPRNEGNGCDLPLYKWTQTEATIQLNVPIAAHKLSGGVIVDLERKHLKVGIKDSPLIIDGELLHEILLEGSGWLVEDQGIISVRLEKVNKVMWWNKLVKTDPEMRMEGLKQFNLIKGLAALRMQKMKPGSN